MEWNETFRARRDPFAPTKFLNLSPEILIEWIAPKILEKSSQFCHQSSKVVSSDVGDSQISLT